MYDYYLQINVRRVNGQMELFEESTVTEQEEALEKLYAGLRSRGKAKQKSVASIFFRFSHRKDGEVLQNQEQVRIVEEIT